MTTRRVQRNMKKLLASAEAQKRQIKASKRDAPKTKRVACPLCDHGNTHKVRTQGGKVRRECNGCGEEFWSTR